MISKVTKVPQRFRRSKNPKGTKDGKMAQRSKGPKDTNTQRSKGPKIELKVHGNCITTYSRLPNSSNVTAIYFGKNCKPLHPYCGVLRLFYFGIFTNTFHNF